MKYIWEECDIESGLHIIKPGKDVTAVIGWNGLSDPETGGRWTITETNTDGMVHGKWLKDENGENVKNDGKLVWTNFTKKELAEHLNTEKERHMWFPKSMFEGNGGKLTKAANEMANR